MRAPVLVVLGYQRATLVEGHRRVEHAHSIRRAVRARARASCSCSGRHGAVLSVEVIGDEHDAVLGCKAGRRARDGMRMRMRMLVGRQRAAAEREARPRLGDGLGVRLHAWVPVGDIGRLVTVWRHHHCRRARVSNTAPVSPVPAASAPHRSYFVANSRFYSRRPFGPGFRAEHFTDVVPAACRTRNIQRVTQLPQCDKFENGMPAAKSAQCVHPHASSLCRLWCRPRSAHTQGRR